MAQVKTNNGTSGGQRHKGESNFKMQYKNLVTDLTLAVHGEKKGKNLILTLNCVGFLDLSTEGETNIGLPFNLVLSMDRAACTEA